MAGCEESHRFILSRGMAQSNVIFCSTLELVLQWIRAPGMTEWDMRVGR